jgi:hypothetical protein
MPGWIQEATFLSWMCFVLILNSAFMIYHHKTGLPVREIAALMKLPRRADTNHSVFKLLFLN